MASYKLCINTLDLGENIGAASLISLENVVFIKFCIWELILDYGDIKNHKSSRLIFIKASSETAGSPRINCINLAFRVATNKAFMS